MTLVEIDPLELAKETLAMMPPRQGAGIELGISGTEACGAFTADRQAVRQAAVNLLYNALKFTPVSGKVWLAFRRLEDRIEVEVGDTGQGMSAEFVRDRLFKPFQTTKQAGMGIGAYESMQYVRELGGRVVVDSTPGVGTRVMLWLPLFDAGDPILAGAPEHPPSQREATA